MSLKDEKGGRRAGSFIPRNLHSPVSQNDNITPEERKALYDYTVDSQINYTLTQLDGNVNELDEDDRYQVEQMDSAIQKSGFSKEYHYGDDGVELRRGGVGAIVGVPLSIDTMWTKSDADKLADYINKYRLGTENTYYGYTSITTDPATAKSFAYMSEDYNPIIIHYHKIEKGLRSAYLSGGEGKTPISSYGEGESESLTERGVVTVPLHAWVGADGFVHVDCDMYRPKKR